MLTDKTLPSDITQLRELCLELQSALTEKDKALSEKEQTILNKQATIDYLHEQLSLLRSKRYQRQSEQLKSLQCQLFDEAELEQAIRETEEALAKAQAEQPVKNQGIEKPTPKNKPRRKPLPDHLKRVEIVIDVSEEDKHRMGDEWVAVGHEVSEQLAVQQREYYVKRYLRVKYVPKQAPQDESAIAQAQCDGGIKVAPRPEVILPKALADASLLADVIASKFVDALSFYRKDKILQREGIHIGYSTLCDWPIQLAQRLEPIEKLLYEQLNRGDLWHLDETTLQVLREPGRDNDTNSYLWAIRAGPPGKPVILFHYHSRRNYEALEQWLSPYVENFSGAIITDEHKPYNLLVQSYDNIQAHGGCWAHLRRKFSDAAKGRRHASEAHTVLAKIAALYKLDKALDGLTGQEKVDARRQKVKPHLEDIKQYLDQLAIQFVSQGLMNTAIHYALNNWHKFTAFIDHAALPLDNNPIERQIRPFTLGRRNWLFSGSPRGAAASAFLYSLIETAKANGWEPKAYLQTLFELYPQAKTEDQRRQLLPMFLNPSK
jgi:transposase